MIVTTTTTTPAPSDPEARLLAQWLHGRSLHTQRAYRAAWDDFRRSCATPLDRVMLADLQDWAGTLAAGRLSPATQALRLTALKSLLSFAHTLGLLPVNVGAALRVPARHSRLAELLRR